MQRPASLEADMCTHGKLQLLLMFLSGIIIAGAVQGGYGHQSDDRSSEAGFNDQSSVLVRTKLVSFTEMF